MNRRQFLGSPAAVALAQKRDFRNVLLLIADDHSPIAGCYGNPVIATPNMDRLAREGTRFSNAFCTTPSCSASRSVVLTGLQNHTNGQFGHAHQPHNFHTHLEVQSIPRVAKANGVATGVIGKLHVLPPEVYTWDFESPGGSKGAPTRDVYGMAQEAGRFFKTIGGRPFYLHIGFGDPHRAGRRIRSFPGSSGLRAVRRPWEGIAGDFTRNRERLLEIGDRAGTGARRVAARSTIWTSRGYGGRGSVRFTQHPEIGGCNG